MRDKIIILTCLLVTLSACDNQDADRLARVARCAAAKGEALAAENGGMQVIQAKLDALTLDARVSARLRWDKSLEGSRIHVSLVDGAIELAGSVRDDVQRKRAVELAENTSGVAKVNDSLDLSP